MSDSPSPQTGAPAPTSPEGDPNQVQVQVELGPDASIYPEVLRPPTEPEHPPAPPESDAPEPAEDDRTPEPPSTDAGAESSPQQGETRGARRRAAEDAYQRGLAEGQAKFEREQSQRAQQQQWETTQAQAQQRVDQLFNDLNSPDYATQDRARQGILQMYHGNRQAQALQTTTRQQILAEMAADFGKLKDLDGITEADYQDLYTAPSAADLAKKALAIGARSTSAQKDEQIAKLEAELQGLRGRLVGSRATPEAHNGPGGDLSNAVSLEQYQAMSPGDARKLSSAQIDALTAQLATDAANGR